MYACIDKRKKEGKVTIDFMKTLEVRAKADALRVVLPEAHKKRSCRQPTR